MNIVIQESKGGFQGYQLLVGKATKTTRLLEIYQRSILLLGSSATVFCKFKNTLRVIVILPDSSRKIDERFVKTKMDNG